jgi:hypothetical protein
MMKDPKKEKELSIDDEACRIEKWKGAIGMMKKREKVDKRSEREESVKVFVSSC